MYRLKKGQEGFTAVEGPLAGRSFVPGQLYAEIPPGEGKRFEEIKTAAPAAEAKKPARFGNRGLLGVGSPEKGEVKS